MQACALSSTDELPHPGQSEDDGDENQQVLGEVHEELVEGGGWGDRACIALGLRRGNRPVHVLESRLFRPALKCRPWTASR